MHSHKEEDGRFRSNATTLNSIYDRLYCCFICSGVGSGAFTDEVEPLFKMIQCVNWKTKLYMYSVSALVVRTEAASESFILSY